MVLAITRQTMANWMIRLGEEYLGVLHDYLQNLLYGYHVIQADETPVLVNRDGRGRKQELYVGVPFRLYESRQAECAV